MQGWAGKAAGTLPGTMQATWWSPWLADFIWVVLHGQLELRAWGGGSAPASVTVHPAEGAPFTVHRSPFTVQSNPESWSFYRGVRPKKQSHRFFGRSVKLHEIEPWSVCRSVSPQKTEPSSFFAVAPDPRK
eukprot:353930-Chlamydomonas_euryale.AAC.3